jgi:hypothetical protein
MIRSACQSAFTMLMVTAVACSSPTDFDPARDVLIAVGDAVVAIPPDESEVSVPLDLTILNRGC